MSKREEHTYRIQTWRNWQNSVKAVKTGKYHQIALQYPIIEEEKKEIDAFYVSNYGEKIPYDCHLY